MIALLVILCIMVVALEGRVVYSMVRAAQEIRLSSRLLQTGLPTMGWVVGSHSAIPHGGHSASSRSLVETIEYPTLQGLVRAVPVYADIGMLDRTGTQVPVFYNPARPDQFIAPRDGRTYSTKNAVLTIVMLGFVSFFVLLLNLIGFALLSSALGL